MEVVNNLMATFGSTLIILVFVYDCVHYSMNFNRDLRYLEYMIYFITVLFLIIIFAHVYLLYNVNGG